MRGDDAPKIFVRWMYFIWILCNIWGRSVKRLHSHSFGLDAIASDGKQQV